MRVDLCSLNAVLTDEEGFLWYVVRFHDHAYSPTFRLRTNGYGENLYSDVAKTTEGYVGFVKHSSMANSHIAESAHAIVGKQGYQFERRIDQMQWDEGSLLTLTGTAACPVMAFVSPDAKGGWGFTSDAYRVEGTVMGRRCRGFFESGTGWAGPGISFMQAYGERNMLWCIVCNQYEDGTCDIAHISHMRGENRFALIANEKGPYMATRDVDLEFVMDQDVGKTRYPKTMNLVLGGEKWRWSAADDRHVSLPPRARPGEP